MSRQNNIINKPEPAPGTLGKLDLFGIGFGAVVGAGMVTLMGPAMAYTGYSVWLAMLLATVLALVMIFPYIILGGTLRVAGGQYSVVTNLTSPSAGGLVIYSNLIFTVQFSTFAMAFGLYMNMVLPTVSAKIFGITIIFLLVGLNLLGINAFAKINNLMSGILLVSMVAYDIYGLTQINQPIFDFFQFSDVYRRFQGLFPGNLSSYQLLPWVLRTHLFWKRSKKRNKGYAFCLPDVFPGSGIYLCDTGYGYFRNSSL